MNPQLMTSTVKRVLKHVGPAAAVKSPKHENVLARKRAMRILDRLGYSASQIGLGLNVHHTTVLHHLGRLGDGKQK